MTKIESYHIAVAVMLIGLLLSFLVYWFYRRKAEFSQGYGLTPWQKYVIPTILLVITSLITAIGFVIPFFFPYKSNTFIEWVKVLKPFLSCFGCLLGISLFFYYIAVLYYSSSLYELMTQRKKKK